MSAKKTAWQRNRKVRELTEMLKRTTDPYIRSLIEQQLDDIAEEMSRR